MSLHSPGAALPQVFPHFLEGNGSEQQPRRERDAPQALRPFGAAVPRPTRLIVIFYVK